MNRSHVLTLRMPAELKQRLQREAKYQGISVNQLSNYLLTIQLTQMETISSLETKLSEKSIPYLKKKVLSILDKVPDRSVPAWDSTE